jgi:hypothetical protein
MHRVHLRQGFGGQSGLVPIAIGITNEKLILYWMGFFCFRKLQFLIQAYEGEQIEIVCFIEVGRLLSIYNS